jgi:hypothetical protein
MHQTKTQGKEIIHSAFLWWMLQLPLIRMHRHLSGNIISSSFPLCSVEWDSMDFHLTVVVYYR